MALERCEKCGGVLRRVVLREYRDPRLGFPGLVLLDAAEEIRCTKCRTLAGIGFPNLSGLIAAAAVARATDPIRFGGDELRALRKALGMTGKVLATALNVRDETVSRWENDKEPIGPTSEKLVRMLVGIVLGERAHLIPFDTQAIMGMRLVEATPSGRKRPEIPLRLVRVSGSKAGSRGAWDRDRKAA